MYNLAQYIFLAIILGAFIALCFLQAKLSRKPARAPGLILPVANILLSIFIIVGYVLFAATGMIHSDGSASFLSDNERYNVAVYSNGSVEAVYTDTGEPVNISGGEGGVYDTANDALVATDGQIGEILEGFRQTETGDDTDNSVLGIAVPVLFFLLNIPAIVYLIIYFLIRRGVNSSEQLGKMEIQDM